MIDSVIFDMDGLMSVSYTHLDVYKRQILQTQSSALFNMPFP